MKRFFLIALLLAPVCCAADLALAPPMGWNSWNKFAEKVDDKAVREMADAMASNGMKDAGYVYVNIDDTWEAGRDAQGNIQTNSKFPDMKALADYVHSKGLKIGIYSSPGPKTCAGYEGSYQHEEQDAKTWAAWGVDYLKYDWCHSSTQDAKSSYANIRNALDAAGRPIVLSICEWGSHQPWLWGKDVGGNLWRTTGDIQARWSGKKEWKPGDCCSFGVVDIIDAEDSIYSYAGPGNWNDPDMLEVGNGELTAAENRSHFSFWALLAAPLMAGNDLRDMKAEVHDILTNKEVIAVNQDPLGRQGRRVWKNGDLEVWSKPLARGARAVILFNRGATEQEITARWGDLDYPEGLSAAVRDLWEKKDLGRVSGRFSAKVPSHGVVMVTVNP